MCLVMRCRVSYIREEETPSTPKPRSLATPSLFVTEERSVTTPTVAAKASQVGLINLTRIDFFSSTWFRDFVAIRAFLSRIPPMNRRDLLTWHKRLRYSLFLTCSCRGYSEGRFSSHSAIISNACIARRYPEVYLHEKKPHLQREANAALHTNDFYCSATVGA